MIDKQKELQEVEKQIDECADAMAEMSGKIDHVNGKFHTTGERADPRWFAAIKSARRRRGQEHQILLRRAAQLRRELSALPSYNDRWLLAAMEILPAEVYSEICKRANELHGSEGMLMFCGDVTINGNISLGDENVVHLDARGHHG